MRVVPEDFEKLQIYDVFVEVVNLSRATYKESAQLKKILDNDIENKIRKIIVDLSQCEFIDSTFLGVLVLSLKESAKIGGDVRLVKPAEMAKELLEKSGTLNVFNLYNSLNDAVQSFEISNEQNYYLSQGANILSHDI
ncbi:MAG: STAS domain-containing protein [Ignavibacteriaceae bacterium]